MFTVCNNYRIENVQVTDYTKYNKSMYNLKWLFPKKKLPSKIYFFTSHS